MLIGLTMEQWGSQIYIGIRLYQIVIITMVNLYILHVQHLLMKLLT